MNPQQNPYQPSPPGSPNQPYQPPQAYNQPPGGYSQQPSQGFPSTVPNGLAFPQPVGMGGQQPQAPYGPPQANGPFGAGTTSPSDGLSSGFDPYAFAHEPAPAAANRQAGPSKLAIAGVIALMIVVVVGTLSFLLMSGSDGNSDKKTPVATENTAGKDVVDRSDGRLDLSSKIVLDSSLKEQTVQAKAKQQVNLSSGFSFMANKLEDYTSPNAATKAADGKKFVVATVVVGNRLQTGNISVSYLDFRLRGPDNSLLPGSVVTNEILENKLASPNEIKPGEQLTGKIVFEVDDTDSSWVLRHSETYQKTTDNTTFDVAGEIVVEVVTAGTSPASPSQATQQ